MTGPQFPHDIRVAITLLTNYAARQARLYSEGMPLEGNVTDEEHKLIQLIQSKLLEANEQGFYAAMGICGLDSAKVQGYYKMYQDALALQARANQTNEGGKDHE